MATLCSQCGRRHYTFTPIIADPNAIRVLRLLPAEGQTKIVRTRDKDGTLHMKKPHRILENMSQRLRAEIVDATLAYTSYEALSYAWGNPRKSTCLEVEGFCLRATEQLHSALVYYRSFGNAEIQDIWVDALCIDQSNNAERTHQVERMAKIYANAKRVVVWLGALKEPEGFQLTNLMHLSQHIDPLSLFSATNLSTGSSRSRTFWNIFFSAPWFERLWVLQEAVWAKDFVFRLGFNEFSWDFVKFHAEHTAIFQTWSNHNSLIESIEQWRKNIQANSTPKVRLEDVVNQTTRNKCSKEEDRIYAVLSLAPVGPGELLLHPIYQPDTTMRLIESELAARTIERNRSLNILQYVSHPGGKIELPSWAPLWRDDRTVSHCIDFPGDLKASDLPHSSGGPEHLRILVVKGRVIGKCAWMARSSLCKQSAWNLSGSSTSYTPTSADISSLRRFRSQVKNSLMEADTQRDRKACFDCLANLVFAVMESPVSPNQHVDNINVECWHTNREHDRNLQISALRPKIDGLLEDELDWLHIRQLNYWLDKLEILTNCVFTSDELDWADLPSFKYGIASNYRVLLPLQTERDDCVAFVAGFPDSIFAVLRPSEVDGEYLFIGLCKVWPWSDWDATRNDQPKSGESLSRIVLV